MTQAYLRARYYDPEIGRFTQEDPAKDGGNWYVYCGNNPVMRVDPSGQSWLDDLWAYLTRAAADVADFWYPTVYAPGTELEMPSPNDAPSKITTVSAYGIEFIRKYESLSLTSYETYPGNGDWTIGWGHKIPAGQLSNFSGGITKLQAEEIFNEDLYMILNTTFLPFLEKYDVKLTQNQFDAMASFTFNLGQYSWSDNDTEAYVTMREFLKAGDYSEEAVRRAFSVYMGNQMEGLNSRRRDEMEMFLYGDYNRD